MAIRAASAASCDIAFVCLVPKWSANISVGEKRPGAKPTNVTAELFHLLSVLKIVSKGIGIVRLAALCICDASDKKCGFGCYTIWMEGLEDDSPDGGGIAHQELQLQ